MGLRPVTQENIVTLTRVHYSQGQCHSARRTKVGVLTMSVSCSDIHSVTVTSEQGICHNL